MALMQVYLAKRISDTRASLTEAQKALAAIQAKRAAMKTREEELEQSVEEVTEETPKDVRDTLDQAVADFQAAAQAAKNEYDAALQTVNNLKAEIERLQKELEGLNQPEPEPVPEPAPESGPGGLASSPRKPVTRQNLMEVPAVQYPTRRAAIAAMVTRSDVKAVLAQVRDAIANKRAITNGALTIPTVMLDLVRTEIERTSKLLPYVRFRHVPGQGRQNILGEIPEAVWTEMCAKLNELNLGFNQVEVDGYKVGGYVPICNALLEDSDENLAGEIVSALSTAIAKALDKAVLYGSGTKMPVGIATRLAASVSPAWWGTNAPAFEDLHETHVLQLDLSEKSGASFYTEIIENLAVAKPTYDGQGLFWAMSRKTHLDLMAKALAFNASAALVSNTATLPIIGGAIIEFEDKTIPDYEIIGGFGGNYLLAERAGMQLASSDIPLFLADQTVFKGTARYDGRPLSGDAFVILNYANQAPTTSATFAEDTANAG